MDAAAHPAGEGFPAQPEAPPAPAKPAAPPALEPGAQWKALPFKLRRKISGAASLMVLAVMVPLMIGWCCWAHAKITHSRMSLSGLKLLLSNVLFLLVVLGLIALVYFGYQYLRYVSPNVAFILDGLRGWRRKWRLRFSNARTAIQNLCNEDELRPDRDKHWLASCGRDALIFGALAILFCLLGVGIGVAARHLDWGGADESIVFACRSSVVTLLLAFVVLGLVALGKGVLFLWAWRRWIVRVLRTIWNGAWCSFNGSENTKEILSARPVCSIFRIASFVVLVALLTGGIHAFLLEGARQIAQGFRGWEKYSSIRFREYTPYVCWIQDATPGGPHLGFITDPSGSLEYDLRDQNWYLQYAMVEAVEENTRKATLSGWTQDRMRDLLKQCRDRIGTLYQTDPIDREAFLEMIEPLKEKGITWTTDESGVEFTFPNSSETASVSLIDSWVVRAQLDGNTLYVKLDGDFNQRFKMIDLENNVSIMGIPQYPAGYWTSADQIDPSGILWKPLMAIASFVSLIAAPFFFLRFTYDPDKDRAKQSAAAASPAPAAAPAAPPST